MRVATAQFELDKDTAKVVDLMVAMIGQAAAEGAQLVHFQECCNYPTDYASREEAWAHALAIPGPMFDAISAAARAHAIFVSFNASVRGDFPNAYLQNNLLDGGGKLICANRKQILMYIEREAFIPADRESQVIDTPFGCIGSLSCMDGLIPETSRVLACKGADIILNSLCSPALDEAHTHIRARAAENGVYMISANRVGDMLRGAELDQMIKSHGMTRERLLGGGESQIVDPNGDVIAQASRFHPGIVYADIDSKNSQRTTRLANRRPECYGTLTEPHEHVDAAAGKRADAGIVNISAIPLPAQSTFEANLQAACQRLRDVPAGIAVLPELFAWNPGCLAHSESVLIECERAVDALRLVARSGNMHIVAGVPGVGRNGLLNQAVLIRPSGQVDFYRQVHRDPHLGWQPEGSDFPTYDLPFGRIGMLVGEDLLYPEAARILARRGADLIACPLTWRANWHFALALPERSAENRIGIVAAARADSPVPLPSAIVSTATTYRFPDTGEVNYPDRWVSQRSDTTVTALVDLSANREKRLMGITNVLTDSRPDLYGALVQTH